MNQSLKASLGGMMFFGALASIMWFGGPPPPGETWQYTVRWIGLFMLFGPIPILVWAQRRKDKVPDFLARYGRYFERDGFCFVVVPEITNGASHLVIYFQNRYQKPCRATVVLKESQLLAPLSVGISCEAAGFGRSSIPWAIPQDDQGKEVSFAVAASVNYPEGRGNLLRYRDGLRVGAVGADFWREGLQIMGAVGGAPVITKPARLKLRTPIGAFPELRIAPECKTEILWKMGDPTGIPSAPVNLR